MLKKERIHNPKVLFIYICAMIGVLGMEAGGLQYNLLLIAEELGLSATQMGSLASMQQVAFILIPYLFGGIGDKYGKKLVMILFGFSFALGCLSMILSTGFFLVAAGIFFMGAGYAMCESTGTSILSDTYKEEASRYINWSQSVFSTGALLSPLLSQWMVDMIGLNWRVFFSVLMIAYIFLSMWAIRLKFPADGKRKGIVQEEKTWEEVQKKFSNENSVKECGNNHVEEQLQEDSCSKKDQTKSEVRMKMILLSVAIAFYASMENGIAYFIGTHVSRTLGTDALNSIAISTFWLLMIPARYLAGVVKITPRKMMNACYLLSALSLVLLVIAKNAPFLLIGYACAGFFFGPVWPLIMAEAGNLEPENSAKISGKMIGYCGMGGMISPIIFGFCADNFNLTVSMIFMVVLTTIGWIVASVYDRRC